MRASTFDVLSAADAAVASFVADAASFVADAASFVGSDAESVGVAESIEGRAAARAVEGSVALTSSSYLSNGADPPCACDRWT